MQSLKDTQRALEGSLALRRAEVAHRLRSSERGGGVPAGRVRDLVEASSARVRELINRNASRPSAVGDAEQSTALPLGDLHTVERLLSYIRHSVVRACFYNLNLLCPSLLDEYDKGVRDKVLRTLDQLPNTRQELDHFFDVTQSDGSSIRFCWPDSARDVSDALGAIDQLALRSYDRLDDPAIRESFATEMPKLIQQVMDALQGIQTDLDSRKVLVEEVLREAVSIAGAQSDHAGLALALDVEPTPKVFAERAALLNAFTEIICNAARYSGGERLSISLSADSGKRFVEVRFRDDGAGMEQQELETCLYRGVSHRGGTGEGLSMVVQIVEADHLGDFQIESRPGEGCDLGIRLPIKYEPRLESRNA